MKHHHGCGHGPRGHGPNVYKFQFGGPHMFTHGMGGCGGFGLDFELETKEEATVFMQKNKKFLESRKAGLESHLKKLNTAIERLDGLNADLAKNEAYDPKLFQKSLIKAFKKFMIEQIDEE